MNKLILSLLLSFTIAMCGFIQAQGNSSYTKNSHSLQFNGGIITPMSSSTGLTGSVQLNYALNERIKLYVYTGYSEWDKYNIVIQLVKEFYSNNEKMFFNSYSADDHILIPVYIGSSVNLHTNKLFTSFLTAEIGYSYLSFNSYDQMRSVNAETGEVLSYRPDVTTKKENKENLFGIGIGAGLFHPISDNTELIFSFKLNSYVNNNLPGLFSRRGTYTAFSAGFNFNI